MVEEKKDSARHPTKWMKVDKFGGEGSNTSVETFLAQFAICADYNCWTEADKAAQLKCCLTGAAGQLLWDSGKPSDLSYDELVVKLRRRYGSVDQEEMYQAKLKALRRKRNQSLAELHQEVKRLMALAYATDSWSDMGEKIAKDYFLAALNDSGLAMKIAEKEVRTLDTAYRHAVRIEANEKAFELLADRDTERGRNSRTVHDDLQVRRVENVDSGQSTVNELRQRVDELARERDQLAKQSSELHMLQEAVSSQSEKRPSFQVAKSGPELTSQQNVFGYQQQFPQSTAEQEHVQTQFAQLPRADIGYSGQQATCDWRQPEHRARPSVQCFGCGEYGHYRRHCGYRFSQSGRTGVMRQQTVPPVQSVVSGQCENIQPVMIARTSIIEPVRENAEPVLLKMSVGGVTEYCCLDTGSEVTLIPYGLVRDSCINIADRPFIAANQTRMHVVGRSVIYGVIDGREFEISGWVSDDVNEIILGIDWLTRHSATWDFGVAEVTLDGYVYPLHAKTMNGACRRITAADTLYMTDVEASAHVEGTAKNEIVGAGMRFPVFVTTEGIGSLLEVVAATDSSAYVVVATVEQDELLSHNVTEIGQASVAMKHNRVPDIVADHKEIGSDSAVVAEDSPLEVVASTEVGEAAVVAAAEYGLSLVVAAAEADDEAVVALQEYQMSHVVAATEVDIRAVVAAESDNSLVVVATTGSTIGVRSAAMSADDRPVEVISAAEGAIDMKRIVRGLSGVDEAIESYAVVTTEANVDAVGTALGIAANSMFALSDSQEIKLVCAYEMMCTARPVLIKQKTSETSAVACSRTLCRRFPVEELRSLAEPCAAGYDLYTESPSQGNKRCTLQRQKLNTRGNIDFRQRRLRRYHRLFRNYVGLLARCSRWSQRPVPQQYQRFWRRRRPPDIAVPRRRNVRSRTMRPYAL